MGGAGGGVSLAAGSAGGGDDVAGFGRAGGATLVDGGAPLPIGGGDAGGVNFAAGGDNVGFVPAPGVPGFPPGGAVVVLEVPGVAAPGITAADGGVPGFAPGAGFVPGIVVFGATAAEGAAGVPGFVPGAVGSGWPCIPGKGCPGPGLVIGEAAPGAPAPGGVWVCSAALCATEGGSEGPSAAPAGAPPCAVRAGG